jgi:3',5'-cyclic AMP phosphodiesterase CpdA
MYILHLSDLHFGNTQDANRWHGQLCNDLNLLLSQLEPNQPPRLDALIISGDIANKSLPEEYEAAELFINYLIPDFQLRRQQIVIVPGNHDFNWKQAEKAYMLKRRTEYHGLRDESHIIDKGEEDTIKVLDPEKYKQRFTHFRDFYKTFVKKPYPLEPEWQYTLHHFPNCELLILGLNSAWQLDHFYTSRASINPNALNNAITEINENPVYKNIRLKIAVWHHPLNSPFEDRIKDHDFMEQLARNGFRLVLHGHIHGAGTEDYRHEGKWSAKNIDIIGAGTFGAPVQKSERVYPLQYNLLKWEGKILTVCTRQRKNLYDAWQPDAMWGVSSDTITASSEYEIELFPKDGSDGPIYLTEHYRDLIKSIMEGSIVPFLGADINLCDRPPKEKDSKPLDWKEDGLYPPTNLELAAYIDKQIGRKCGYLETVGCPLISGTSLDALPKGLPPECPLITRRITRLDLDRVSQYLQSKNPSSDKLKHSINYIYHQTYKVNSLHKFLVRLIKEVYSLEVVPEKFSATSYPLIVTTCFDRTLERAFEKEPLSFDLVSYTSSLQKFIYQKFDRQNGGKEMSWTEGEIISEEKKVANFWLQERPVILRLYGPVDWNNNRGGENFAITEDHFLDYLACDISHQLPTKLWTKLLNGRLWFLGYSLSYWNLRFIIRQIKENVESKYQNKLAPWWAVQEKADILDEDLWSKNVRTFFSDREIGSLEQYLKEIGERLTDELQKLPKPPARRQDYEPR